MTLEKALQVAAAESSEYFTKFIESSYAPESKYIPSPAFERKIKKLSRRADHPVRYRIGRAVACALLAAALCFGSVMAVSPSARATVIRWVVEWYETHIVYRYTGDPPAEAIPQYEITALPEGYSETERFAYSTSATIIYESPDGGIICLDYVYMYQGAATIIVEDEAIPVSVNGLEGQLYLAAQQDGTSTNTITWIDPEANIHFTMDTPLGQDVLLHMAESVHQRDSDETNSTAMPQYEIAVLPEGYAENNEKRIEQSSYVRISYQNEIDSNAQTIYLRYVYMQEGSAAAFVIEGAKVIPVTVNGLEGQLFLEDDWENNRSTITWVDPERNLQFAVDAAMTEKDIIALAESVLEIEE